jgi:hypothetical protein
MRILNRNKQPIHYATFASKEEILDEYGNPTGQYKLTYTTPQRASWNVGFVESDAEVEMFGIAASSTLRIVAPKDGFPLDETSILWFGITPEIKQDGTTDTAHNYRVVGIRPSLNTVKFYAQKVSVTQVVEQEPIDPEEPEGPEEPIEGDG